MRRKSNDHILRPCVAELAGFTVLPFAVGSRANNNFVSALALPEFAAFCFADHHHSTQTISHSCIRFRFTLATSVYGEAVCCGSFERLNHSRLERMVAIGETTLATVCLRQALQRFAAHRIIRLVKITADVMAPQLPFGQSSDFFEECKELVATLAGCDRCPVNSLRTTVSKAAAAVLLSKRTGSRACVFAAGASRNRTKLAVLALGGQMKFEHGAALAVYSKTIHTAQRSVKRSSSIAFVFYSATLLEPTDKTDKMDKTDKTPKKLEIEARQSYALSLLEQGVNTTATATMVSARFQISRKTALRDVAEASNALQLSDDGRSSDEPVMDPETVAAQLTHLFNIACAMGDSKQACQLVKSMDSIRKWSAPLQATANPFV